MFLCVEVYWDLMLNSTFKISLDSVFIFSLVHIFIRIRGCQKIYMAFASIVDDLWRIVYETSSLVAK